MTSVARKTSISQNTDPAQLAGQQPARPVGDDRPRIEEQQFHVEHQEQDRDEVELHVEPLAGVADRVHARFVGHLLDRRFPAGPMIWVRTSTLPAKPTTNRE